MNISREVDPLKVCLIVDNPLRDLEGLCLLGWHLVRNNVEVYLVSLSHLHEIFFIRPDLVLLNYVRKANSAFIKRCIQLGILIGVLDTEGGILKDVDFFFESIFRHVDRVDLYCFWGRQQYDAMERLQKLPVSTMKITGCPRYDFCVPPWSEALPEVSIGGGNMVLVNTNFPLVQPRFQSAGKEAQQLVSDVGFDKEYVDKLVSQTGNARSEVVKKIRSLASLFSDTLFVIRPHPFEGSEYYEKSFSDFTNVEVHQSGSVFPWIKQCTVLLHHNCSTAVEAVLMGKEPIHMGWIDAPLLEQKSSVKVSHCPSALDELSLMLERVFKGQKLDISEEKKIARQEVIDDWFYSNDGKNSERVADAIVDTLGSAVRKGVSRLDYLKVFIFDPLAKRDYRTLVKHILLLILGGERYCRVKRVKYRSGKEFSAGDVKGIMDRIGKITAEGGNNAITVDTIRTRYVASSVRIREVCS